MCQYSVIMNSFPRGTCHGCTDRFWVDLLGCTEGCFWQDSVCWWNASFFIKGRFHFLVWVLFVFCTDDNICWTFAISGTQLRILETMGGKLTRTDCTHQSCGAQVHRSSGDLSSVWMGFSMKCSGSAGSVRYQMINILLRNDYWFIHCGTEFYHKIF